MKNFLIEKMTRAKLGPFIALYSSDAYTLDIGCANSPYSIFFKNRVGFDIRVGKGVDVVGDVHAMPFLDNTFDQILCTEVLEHLHSPEKAISEMYRVLKSGGKIILTTRFIFPLHDTPEDYFRFTKYGLRHLFREWNIKFIKEEAGTMETFAILMQRVAFQSDMHGGKITKALVLIFARCLSMLRFFVKKEYGRRSKVGIYPENIIHFMILSDF